VQFATKTTLLQRKSYFKLNLMRDTPGKTRINNNGGPSTLLGYCLLHYLDQSDLANINANKCNGLSAANTNEEIWHFGFNRNQFIEKIFADIDKDKAQSLYNNDPSLYDNDTTIGTTKRDIVALIDYTFTQLTTTVFSEYNKIIHRENVITLTTNATYSAIDLTETTNEVATAIAKEHTIDEKQMMDIIDKRVQDGINKEKAKNSKAAERHQMGKDINLRKPKTKI
jgi:hypothetical protein